MAVPRHRHDLDAALRRARAQYALSGGPSSRRRGAAGRYSPSRVRALYLYCVDLSARLAHAPALSETTRAALRLVLWRHMFWGAARCYSDPETLRTLEGCAYALGMIASIYGVGALSRAQRIALLDSLRPPSPPDEET